MKILNAFLNWGVKEEHLLINQAKYIKRYKVQKSEMKYWTSSKLKKVLNTLEEDIKSNNFNDMKKAMLVKSFILIEFSLGDRAEETRALIYDCFDEFKNTVRINHSISYNRKSNDFLVDIKNYQSQRTIDVSNKLIETAKDYELFLLNYDDCDVKDSDLIFFSYSTNKPYSDNIIRNYFYYYFQ